MKRTEPKSIGELMREAIDAYDMRQDLDRAKAAQCWGAVVGPGIAALCGQPSVSGSVLNVPCASNALRQELSMRRSSIVADINAHIGRPVISDIRFISKSFR